MKRKLATLLTLALTVTMLWGCGGSTQTATSSGTTNNNSNGTFASSKSGTLSECLSTEKVIAYEVDTVDKSETPDNIYFFEDGKVTIIPGEEFGLTMGDFAQMEDDEIWSTYETVRETYVENYLDDSKKEELDNYSFKLFCEQEDNLYENSLYGNINTYEELQLVPDILDAVKGKTYEEAQSIPTTDIIGEGHSRFYRDRLGDAADTYLISYINVVGREKYSEDEFYWERSYPNYNEDAVYTGVVFDDAVEHYNYAIASIEELKDDIGYHGPFFDIPFSFVIETDSTGNNVANEKLVYPTLEDTLGNAPSEYYQYIKFANVEGADKQIYDTTYNCFGLGSGEAIFCTRASMTLDTVDSKNVLIDLSEDEINELFKDEVMARYE